MNKYLITFFTFLFGLCIYFPIVAQASISSPTDISGSNLKLWLDSSDIDGDNNSLNDPLNGSAVSTWVDKSGNNKNATQVTANVRPTYSTLSLNGKPTISFPGVTAKYLQTGSTSDWNFLHNGSESTIFIVAKGTTSDNNTDFMLSSGGSGVARGFSFGRAGANSGRGLFAYISDGVGGYPFELYPATSVPNNFGVWSIVQKSSPVVKLYENGLLVGTSSSYVSPPSVSDAGSPLSIGIDPDDIGAGRPLAGNVAEIIIYNRALTAQERIDVQSYLETKWNQPATLSDVDPPVINSFTSSSSNGDYGVGQRINITANFSENLATGSSMTVLLNSGAQVVLSTISNNSLSGTYVVKAGEVSSDLSVSSISLGSISDRSENTSTAYSVPLSPNNINDSKDIIINTNSLPEIPFVIIAGQSNALGRALLSGITRADGTPTVKILDQAIGSFQTLQQGVNQHYSNPTTQFGPEMGMAYLYKDEGSSKPLYILKYAIGNTQLASIPGNDWNSGSSGEYFDNMISLAQGAFDQIHSAGYTPNLLGVVWMQGENDGTSSTYANLYQTNLSNLINTTRTRLEMPNLPYVVGRIRQDDPSAPFSSTVRTAEAAVVSGHSNSCLIDTDDLNLFDQVHFDSQSQMTLGARFWNALKKCDHTAPSLISKTINENSVVLTFDEPINTYSVPAESAFVIRVNGAQQSISGLAISGSKITFSTAAPVTSRDTVTLEYVVPVLNKVADWSLNSLATISTPVAVTNLTAVVNGAVFVIHTECNDGVDNDKDGFSDSSDSGCRVPGATSEFSFPTTVLPTSKQVTPSTACVLDFNQILKLTNPRISNANVRLLQSCMSFRIKSNKLTIDGIFGIKTKQAVEFFQRLNGVKVDGIVGPLTKSKLINS